MESQDEMSKLVEECLLTPEESAKFFDEVGDMDWDIDGLLKDHLTKAIPIIKKALFDEWSVAQIKAEHLIKTEARKAVTQEIKNELGKLILSDNAEAKSGVINYQEWQDFWESHGC